MEAAAEKLAGEAGMDEEERFRVGMAVREAAVNAVLHGNEYDPAKQITACFENTGKELIFTLSDQGKGLDLEALPDPLAPENLLRGTGRGIFLIRSFMDEVHVRQLHPGTELTLSNIWRRQAINCKWFRVERWLRTTAFVFHRWFGQAGAFTAHKPAQVL